jgi:hypothetical protein
MWAEIATNNFDLMIDDGLHTFESAICLFENSINKLAPNGTYIIEDASINDLGSGPIKGIPNGRMI